GGEPAAPAPRSPPPSPPAPAGARAGAPPAPRGRPGAGAATPARGGPRRGGHDSRVDLPHKDGEDVPVALPDQAIEVEGLAAEQPALADEEELHAGLRPLPHQPADVFIRLLGGDDLLGGAPPGRPPAAGPAHPRRPRA